MASSDFDWVQMVTIREAYENGLTDEQVAALVKDQIYENGLTDE